jgi:hypothetical protein
MSPDGGDALDEQLSDLLAAYDEAVAAGHTPDPRLESSAPPELLRRFRRARDCLHLLERARQRETEPELTDPGGLPAA